jgi:hypothetical protein
MEHSELVAAVEPEALRASLAANAELLRSTAHGHPGHAAASVRSVTYKGHEIVIRTTYEMTVDGQPFAAHVVVDNSGRVHYHGLPTRDFSSTVSLIKKAIDLFPEDFAGRESGHGHMDEPVPAHGAMHEGAD